MGFERTRRRKKRSSYFSTITKSTKNIKKPKTTYFMDVVIRIITGVNSITEDSNSSREETNNNRAETKTKEVTRIYKETRGNKVNFKFKEIFKETFKDFKGINPRRINK